MVYIIASVGNDQNNVTGEGTDYVIDWDGTLIDPNSFWSNNHIALTGQLIVTMNVYLKLGGLSALNNRINLFLNTTDGDVPIYSGNPSGGLLTANYDLNLTRILILNPNGNSNYTANIKCEVLGGLSDTVDILSGSSFVINF